jgi:hypothetical protein
MVTAIVGILEVQGLSACAGLPDTSVMYPSEEFSLSQLTQEGTAGWNYFINVLADVDYAGNSGQPGGPACGYEGTVPSRADRVELRVAVPG